MTVKEAIEHLQKYHKLEDEVAMHLWGIDDVLGVADDEKIILTKDEAEEIISDIHNHIDSEYGITWETLRCTVQDFDRDRE